MLRVRRMARPWTPLWRSGALGGGFGARSLNYRHSFKAGNHGDVLKHSVLLSIVRRMQRKDTPVLWLDTHASRGVFDLRGEAAERSQDAAHGVQMLMRRAAAGTQMHPMCREYLEFVAGFDREWRMDPELAARTSLSDASARRVAGGGEGGGEAGPLVSPSLGDAPEEPPGEGGDRAGGGGAGGGEGGAGVALPSAVGAYPGSAMILRSHLRPSDRLVVSELHPGEGDALSGLYPKHPHHRRVYVHAPADGYKVWKAHVPPLERRGLVLCDPPYERDAEFELLIKAYMDHVKRFQTGTVLIWYPIKSGRDSSQFVERMKHVGVSKLLACEVLLRDPKAEPERLNGSGLLILNPPYLLKEDLDTYSKWLAGALGDGKKAGARGRCWWVTPDVHQKWEGLAVPQDRIEDEIEDGGGEAWMDRRSEARNGKKGMGGRGARKDRERDSVGLAGGLARGGRGGADGMGSRRKGGHHGGERKRDWLEEFDEGFGDADTYYPPGEGVRKDSD